ncbi:MAG: cyclic nucleotide-binding domain-containing protein [Leptospiraceae bacterium]|nr:cyclic nucleotide-binding domain-containing protein [Leptospiraceae bacterium]
MVADLTGGFNGLDQGEIERIKDYLEVKTYEAGAEIVHIGAVAEDMYFVLEGEGRINRNGLELGSVHKGDHFGELGLISGRPRAATIVAISPLTVARLERTNFNRLVEHEPHMAARLMLSLINTLGRQLVERTESLDMLLRQRSLPRQATVRIHREDGTTQQLKTGSPIHDAMPAHVDGRPVVAALIDRRVSSLDTQVFSDADVSPITTAHWEGERVMRHSLALILAEAASELMPPVLLQMGQGLGAAQWVEFTDTSGRTLQDIADHLTRRMRELIQNHADFRQEWWNVDEARHFFARAGRFETVELINAARSMTIPLVTVGRYYAIYNGPLLPHAGLIDGFRLQVAEGGLILLSGYGAEVPDGFAAFARLSAESGRWLSSFDLTSVGQLNRACIDGRVREVIRVAEGYHEKRLAIMADEIVKRGGVKVVCVAGPSSSGKTTFIRRLSTQLRINGTIPEGISLDDYYLGRDKVPLNRRGEKDFETIGSLDLALIAQHLRQLIAGEEIATARYDFHTGACDPQGGRRIQLGESKILLLEGIHGLNPALLEGIVPPENVFRIFLQPLLTLPFDPVSHLNPSDLRLLRRVVRDRHSRGFSAAENIRRWSDVREGEHENIFPFVSAADAVFDTSLVYEISVLKVFADRYLLEVPPGHASFATAFRLRQILDQFVAISPDDVPSTSILREFIGASSFDH